MTVFRVQKNSNYTVMSNEHLRNPGLSLKAKGLLSQMLSLPEDWDYSLEGLSRINKEGIDAIRTAIRELEHFGYLERHRVRDELGKLTGTEYIVHERAVSREVAQLVRDEPALENPTLDFPTLDYPTLGNPTQADPTQGEPTLGNPRQINKEGQSKDLRNKEEQSARAQKRRKHAGRLDDEYACPESEVL